jgi:SmpA / OmlA family
MKKRAAVVMTLLLGLCLVGVWLRGHESESQINLDSYKRIKQGMTRQQVEEILGGPARNESEGRDVRPGPPYLHVPLRTWHGPRFSIYVVFDENEFAQTVILDDPLQGHHGIWDIIRSWLTW